MFGHFKGFTLKPLPNSRTTPPAGATNVAFVHPVTKIVENADTVPSRSAPPIPSSSSSSTSSSSPHVKVPPLPPFNPGSTARPLISSPILEASTCSAKELISPLRNNADRYPIRQAPAPPPKSFTDSTQSRPPTIAQPALHGINGSNGKKPARPSAPSAIQRIASFLRKDDRISAAAPKLKPTLDKDSLKSIKISSPISSGDLSDTSSLTTMTTNSSEATEVAQSERPFIARTQSMREPSTTTPRKPSNIQSFGSMRYPDGTAPRRPGSIVATGGNSNSRPKSPPPPRPPAPPTVNKVANVTTKSVAFAPKITNEYDDCEAIEKPISLSKITEDHSCDNIYSVIDEYQRPTSNKLLTTKGNSGSGGSGGLLGEIVNEIENRNLDSIYSANRKKSPEPIATTTTYANTTEDDYLNMKSNVSTTSSGYLRPSALNAPVARVAPVNKTESVQKPPSGSSNIIGGGSSNLSSFKSNKEVNAKPVVTAVKPPIVSTKPEKPPIAVKSVLPSSSAATTTATVQPKSTNTNNFSRTKTPPSLQPIKAATTTTTPQSKTTPTVKSTLKTEATKPLLKKAEFSAGIGGNATTKPKWKTSDSSSVTNSGSKTTNDGKNLSNGGASKFGATIGRTGSSGASAASSMSTAAAGAAKKNSSVASIQQKFEVNNKKVTNNSTATTLKK